MASIEPQIPQRPQRAIHPTPPPLSCHTNENNDVTPVMTRNACQNKELKRRIAASPEWLTPFEPRRGLSNGHLQTIVGNYLRRPPLRIEGVTETVEVDPADGSRVLCHCHWQAEPDRGSRLTLLMVHGLEGSSNSRYIQGITGRAWNAGCNVIRMNMRNCGGTDTLTPTLYHSGQSGDVGAVLRHYAQQYSLERVALVGYSMGGNLVLKLAGEWSVRRLIWQPGPMLCTSH